MDVPDVCKVCGGQVKIMTPPEKGICSENCLKAYRDKKKPKQHRSVSDTPVRPRGTQDYGHS